MNDTLFKVGLMLNDLPRAERAFAQAVIESPSSWLCSTLSKLAYETGSSEAAIIRFCKRLGFNGINEFKIAISEASQTELGVDRHTHSSLETLDIMREMYKSTLQILNDTIAQGTDNYDKAVMSLMNAQSINFLVSGKRILRVCSVN